MKPYTVDQSCYGGKILNYRPKKYQPFKCCGMVAYSPLNKGCCGLKVYSLAKAQCCCGELLDPGKHLFCDNTRFKRTANFTKCPS